MSIVKNNDNVSNTAVTIKRLAKDTAVMVDDTDFYFRYYMQFNNKYAIMPWYHAQGESVFIKCEIEENAEGYIYGHRGSSTTGANIYVKNSNGVHEIQWREGDTVVWSEPWDDKVHIIGYKGEITDITTLAEERLLRPFYDGDTIMTQAAAISSSGNLWNARVGSVLEGDSSATQSGQSIHSTGSWAMRIYEIFAESFPYQSQIYDIYTYHFYPAVYNLSATQGLFVETRSVLVRRTMQTGSSQTGVTASDSVVNFPVEGYGVQLHDLKIITGSAYNDMIAILTEDGGIDTAAGFRTEGVAIGDADVANTLTKDNVTRKFAFSLKNMPVPSGWTYSGGNTMGELAMGRKPRWSIWNDSIKFGKYVGTVGNKDRMLFNLFANNDGTYNADGFDLRKFEGYDTSKNFPPSYEMGDDSNNILIEQHNGVPCTIRVVDKVVGGSYDERTVFFYTLASGAIGTIKLGNLPPWNYTAAEVDEDAPNEGMQKLCVFGGGLIFKAIGSSSIAETKMTLIELTKDKYEGTDYPLPLTSDSSEETKDKFKTVGFSGEAFFRETFVEYARYYLHLNDTPVDPTDNKKYIDLYAVLCLSKTASTTTPNDSQIIDCTNFAPEKKIRVKGNDNPHIYSAVTTDTNRYYGDRLVIGDIGGTAKVSTTEYKLNVPSYSSSANYDFASVTVGGGSIGYYGRALAVGFALVPNSGNTLPDLYDGSNNQLYVGYADINIAAAYSTDVNSAIVNMARGFAKLVKTDASVYPNPFYLGSVFQANTIYPKGMQNVSYTKIGTAMFMWDDLLQPGKNRGSSGSAPTYNTDTGGDYLRPSNPLTANVMVFKKDEAPHAWNIYAPYGLGTQSGWYWWNDAEAPYVNIGSIDYFLHPHDFLFDMLNYNVIDGWMSLYEHNTTTRIVNSTSAPATVKNTLVGRTISVYSQPVYEPNEQRVTTALFSHTIDSSTGWGGTNDSYSRNITNSADGKAYTVSLEIGDVPFWAKMKDGSGVNGAGSFVHVMVRSGSDDISYLKAMTFFINIT